MSKRAMIVLAAGTSSRFGGEKILAEIAGQPLIAHTLAAVIPTVDRCVVVCRHDNLRAIEALGFDCDLVPGGSTRTASEIAGLAALGPGPELIGIHDGARPAVSPGLIEALFLRADSIGGAVPATVPDGPVVDRDTSQLLRGVMSVQTPQVFRGDILRDSYSKAAGAGLTGHDTVDLVMRFSDARIAIVPGEAGNIKVTHRGDLGRVEEALADPSRSEPR